jgi:hypothetical protein
MHRVSARNYHDGRRSTMCAKSVGIADSISVRVKITTTILASTQICFHLHETLPSTGVPPSSVAGNVNLKLAFPCGATWQLMAQLLHDVVI